MQTWNVIEQETFLRQLPSFWPEAGERVCALS
jgi:hypothetical protein